MAKEGAYGHGVTCEISLFLLQNEKTLNEFKEFILIHEKKKKEL